MQPLPDKLSSQQRELLLLVPERPMQDAMRRILEFPELASSSAASSSKSKKGRKGENEENCDSSDDNKDEPSVRGKTR